MSTGVTIPHERIKLAREGFGVVRTFEEMYEKQIEEFQEQMLNSRWPLDEAEL